MSEKAFPPYWDLRPGEHGDMVIFDRGAGTPICSLYCGPNEVDCIRYLIDRANEGNAVHVEKLAAEGKLETGEKKP